MSDLAERTRWWVEDIHRKGHTDDERKVRRVGGLGVGFTPSDDEDDTGTEAVEVPEDLILGVSNRA